MSLADQLRQIIHNSGLSLYRIAADSGVPYSALHGFVKDGRDLMLVNVDRLASLFGIRFTAPTKRKADRRSVEAPRRS